MTNTMWNEAIEWANGNRAEGDWAEHEGRQVEIVAMCGGRFLCTEGGEVCGLVETPLQAVWFLLKGEVLGAA